MSKIKRPNAFASIAKRAKRGMRGYPVATVAFYGPDDGRASKCVVSIVTSPDAGENDDDDGTIRKWFSDNADLRHDAATAEEATVFIETSGAKSVVVSGIIGCPHEEGIDYEGDACPQCPFWRGRDRWRGLHGQ